MYLRKEDIWVHTDRREWELRYNKELYHLYGALDIFTDIRIARLRWLDHVHRTNNYEMLRKKMENTPMGRKISLEGPDLDRWMMCCRISED